MKIKYPLLVAACASLVFFSSCEDKHGKDDGDDSLSDNEYVNKWIYEKMDEWYLWRDQMPDKEILDSDTDPKTFFTSLLYEKESRFKEFFSTIKNSNTNESRSAQLDNNTPTSSLGFEYIPVPTDSPTLPVAFVVVYVHKKTNASAQGIKRGDVILKVGDSPITMNNYQTILSQNTTGSYKFNIINDGDKIKEFDLTITPTFNYEENPIFLDSIYVKNNKKIGYLVYNQYEYGNSSTRPYDVELAQKLTNFKQKGITDLILDLRYNGGGYVASAQVLCSALVPQRNTKNIFEIKTYNSVKQARYDGLPDSNAEKIRYMYDYFVDNVTNLDTDAFLAAIPKLGDQLNSIYVLGTENTASASELTINALRAYREVIVVGETTRGKNVGGWEINKKDDTRNTYAISPIIFKSWNKDKKSDYAIGFDPQVGVRDFGLLTKGGLKQLGDEDETMLNAALAAITGGVRNRSARVGGIKHTKLPGSSLDRKRTAYQLLDTKEID